MKKLHLNYQPPILRRVAVKRSSVPRPAAIFHAHACCNECFRKSLYRAYPSVHCAFSYPRRYYIIYAETNSSLAMNAFICSVILYS